MRRRTGGTLVGARMRRARTLRSLPAGMGMPTTRSCLQVGTIGLVLASLCSSFSGASVPELPVPPVCLHELPHAHLSLTPAPPCVLAPSLCPLLAGNGVPSGRGRAACALPRCPWATAAWSSSPSGS